MALTMSPPRLEVAVAGTFLRGNGVLRLEALLGADRPDRLQVCFATGEASGGDAPRAFRPGDPVRVSLGGRLVFEGTADRTVLELDPSFGMTHALIAYADYHGRRGAEPKPALARVTDGEFAAAVARFLGLVAAVEPTEPVHSRLAAEGDPLAFLRRRARRIGVDLAVTRSTLHFGRSVGEIGKPVRLRGPSSPLRVEIVDRFAAGRGGRLQVLGDPELLPLRRVELEALDPSLEGSYRIIRAEHRIDRRGYLTDLTVLEEGLDYALWSRGALWRETTSTSRSPGGQRGEENGRGT